MKEIKYILLIVLKFLVWIITMECISKLLGNSDFFLIGLLVGIIFIFVPIIANIIENQTIMPSDKDKMIKGISKKEIPEDFKLLYRMIVDKYSYELEYYRKELVKRLIVTVILFIGTSIIYISSIYMLGNNNSLLGYMFVPVLLYLLYIYKKYNKKYQKTYKDIVINEFLDSLPYRLNYNNRENSKLIKYFFNANFINTDYCTFSSDDYISGYAKKIWIEISDIKILKQFRKGKQVHWTGIMSYSKINKNIHGEVRIKRNKLIKKSNNTRIALDSGEFEKKFDVFANSRILAMEILTHDVMEEIIQFINSHTIDFEIVIKENKIFIKYEVGDIFEGKILSKSTNIKSLWVCYNVINFIINLTTKINKILEEKEV